MIHGGIVHDDQQNSNLLMLNKYYIIPAVNVDGLAFIEKTFIATGKLKHKRKNGRVTSDKCPESQQGVDLNRNFGFMFGSGDNSNDPCTETYRGVSAFSEPETRAIRDFMTAHKDEIKFVYNFHTAGKVWFMPYVGQFPNTLKNDHPSIFSIFSEISKDA
jgi:hypothetical protein